MTASAIALPTPLVDVDWLYEHHQDANLVIVDCRFALSDPDLGRRAYDQGHIPGAVYLDLNRDLSGPVQPHGGRHPLPELATLVAKLAAIGISSDPATAVVAYDATKGAFAARLWWLLRYLGHTAVAVLDGGLPAWQAADLPLDDNVPHPTQGKFVPHPQEHWVVDRSFVQGNQGSADRVLVDARSPERYRGEQEPIDPVAGSIPGALNFFWQENLDDRGRFKGKADLDHLWSKIPTANTSVFYCGSGVTACVNILAHAVRDRPLPKLYVGGWSDWCSYEFQGSAE